MIITGQVIKYGNDINTDVIFPGRYTYTVNDPGEMARHAMEDLDPDFPEKVKNACIIVAGKNFGCGSSREQAVTALKFAGIKAIIAKSFARIYYRNAINLGVPPIKLDSAGEINEGDKLEINLEKGIITNKTTGKSYTFTPFPGFILEIIKDGGLLENLKKKIEKKI